jgi:hypothetical protein
VACRKALGFSVDYENLGAQQKQCRAEKNAIALWLNLTTLEKYFENLVKNCTKDDKALDETIEILFPNAQLMA